MTRDDKTHLLRQLTASTSSLSAVPKLRPGARAPAPWRAAWRGAVLPDQVRLDLQWMARDFETLLTTAPTDRLDQPTDGTRWTNRQLL